ncbi:hypothetical protein BJ170DRAFT_607572 [Xylariales sp. AK1849]|nr:hypothetical protein BJ170DRAFT_607572 [Xylariales sp. AK1849]
MGTSCGKLDKDAYSDEQHEKQSETSSSKIPKSVLRRRRGDNMAAEAKKASLVTGIYAHTGETRLDSTKVCEPLVYQQKGDYDKDRAEIEGRGKSLGFDYKLTQAADQLERDADHKLKIMKHNDDVVFYDSAPEREGYGGQKHRRFAGDHFMSNADLLETTGLFHVAHILPKGAHLHIHFNSTLLPHVLLDIAEGMDTMCICSDLPLISEKNLNCCEIQFLVKQDDIVKAERAKLLEDEQRTRASKRLTQKKLESELCNILDERYQCPQNGQGPWMKFNDFRKQWNESDAYRITGMSSKEWLISKLVFNEQESHHPEQTADGAWVKFNGRTRMMKGLFNYESAFREYTRRCLEEFEWDNIQYAEIRPNFMQTNQIWRNDGSSQLTNRDTMDAIIDEWTKFNQESNRLFGLKVIYCTPRSFPNHLVKKALDECLQFKLNPAYKDYIAGFDLVGEEAKGRPLRDFVEQFLEFKEDCRRENVVIPFLFHCGETLELGGTTDGNLIDALLLDSKRIGHGYALARKPYLMTEFKKRNICLEICPISNEVLGLTSRISGHAMYDLLANDVHCTVNSDNGTLFRSTLSHDFYQVMVGSKAMNLHGWRQLIEWSIEHASLDQGEHEKLKSLWEPRWDSFIQWVNREFAEIQVIKPNGELNKPKEASESEEQWQARLAKDKQRVDAEKLAWRRRIKNLPSPLLR